jgi:hypothetical protein
MTQSLSWEDSDYSASQEISCLLRNKKSHSDFHKSPLLVPVLSHMNLVHALILYFFKIHLNIILPSKSRSENDISSSGSLTHSFPIPLDILYLYTDVF